MPRNIESIIDNHNTATERRKAGKPVWDHRLTIKHHLTCNPADAPDIGKKIAATLRACTWYTTVQKQNPHDDLVAIAEELDDIDDAEHFNAVLDRLYDIADADRVWIN